MEIVKGCGVDIIEIERIKDALQHPRFAQRVFTAREQELLANKQPASWAVRFAAKEAAMKALGCGWQGGVSFADIEVLRDSLGKPVIDLWGKAADVAADAGVVRLLVSLSHSREIATAYVIAVGKE